MQKYSLIFTSDKIKIKLKTIFFGHKLNKKNKDLY